ncbi:SWPV1-184 [Shearwaterpox virus]|uniref:SWPV1-184 n=1 Tax=Shearwaterpox virus TaxID=1974596 RepID=A0A1V0S863_CNPV|nr:SWPV1-184 [Shearwaterpox virus]
MNIITCHSYKNFDLVKYNGISLVIMKSNNYINATKLCESQQKNFKTWKRLSTSKFLIKDVKELNKNLKVSNVIIEVKDNNSDITGFYVHQDLIYSIAHWISPIFAIKVNKVINFYLYNNYEIIIKEMQNDITSITNIANDLVNDYYKTITEIIEILNKFDNYHETSNNDSICSIYTCIKENMLDDIDRTVFFI